MVERVDAADTPDPVLYVATGDDPATVVSDVALQAAAGAAAASLVVVVTSRPEPFVALSPVNGRPVAAVVAYMWRDGWADALDAVGGVSVEGGPDTVVVEMVDGEETVIARGYGVRVP